MDKWRGEKFAAGGTATGRDARQRPPAWRSAGGVGRTKEKAQSGWALGYSILAEWTGLEPATPGVTGRYSDQLNYHSVLLPTDLHPTARLRVAGAAGANCCATFELRIIANSHRQARAAANCIRRQDTRSGSGRDHRRVRPRRARYRPGHAARTPHAGRRSAHRCRGAGRCHWCCRRQG